MTSTHGIRPLTPAAGTGRHMLTELFDDLHAAAKAERKTLTVGRVHIDDSLRRIANQAFFDRIHVSEVDTTDPELGEPFDLLLNPAVQAEALHRRAIRDADDEALDRSSHVEGLNNVHRVGATGLEPVTFAV